MDKKTRILVSIASVVILGLGTLIGVLLVQGYTYDTKNKRVVQTGVLVVNSVPNGAQIYIDDHYQNVTNTSISFLPAKNYKIRITKEGYIPWEKEITINNQIISEIEAIMWPATPSVNPITNTGAIGVKLSPDMQKAAYAIRFNEQDKAGLWIMDMAKRTVFSGTSTDYTQIARNTSSLDFSSAELLWSPDSKQILATLQEGNKPEPRFTRNFLLDISRLNTTPSDVTLTKDSQLKTWNDELGKIQNVRMTKMAGDPEGTRIASESAIPLKWSYDETMFLYATRDPSSSSVTEKPKVVVIPSFTKTTKVATISATVPDAPVATAAAEYVRQIESQTASYSGDMNIKVYHVMQKKSFDLPKAQYYAWYPAEEKADREIQHLVMVDDGSISIIETDGKNKSTIYSGPFENNIAFPWPDGGRLVILTNFNFKAGSEPNIYTINLR
ncbi:MAG: PEGA domain-containing protein [bacterium]|nr:PEGA domain-containing protein [bacterium]